MGPLPLSHDVAMTVLSEIFEPTEATATVVYEDGSTNADDELDE